MRLHPGQKAPPLSALTIHGQPVALPDSQGRLVHLQFRRFAGCPVCNFHLMEMGRRRAEIDAAGIHQVVLFHSSPEEMLKYQAQLPFDCVADLDKRHYRAFGVETSWRALLSLGVPWHGFRWILAARRFYNKAENGILGLPADFLIDGQGQVVACQYGAHADDQWDVDEVLGLARQAAATHTMASAATVWPMT